MTTRIAEHLCAALMAVMVALLFTQVAARYAFQAAPPWTEELARGVFIYLTFVGAGVAVAHRAHLKIDVLVNLLPAPVKAALRLGNSVIAVAFLVVLELESWNLLQQLSAQSLASVSVSKGLFFAAVPIGGLLMLVHEVIRIRQDFGDFLRLRRTEQRATEAQDDYMPVIPRA